MSTLLRIIISIVAAGCLIPPGIIIGSIVVMAIGDIRTAHSAYACSKARGAVRRK